MTVKDWSKPLRTIGTHYKAILLNKDNHPDFPYSIAINYRYNDYIYEEYDNWKTVAVSVDGSNIHPMSPIELFEGIENDLEIVEGWVNVYDVDVGVSLDRIQFPYKTREDADKFSGSGRKYTVFIHYEK